MVTTFNFTTGVTNLPDIGTLSYNGCTFSPLFTTEVSGSFVKDNAQRTVKYVEFTISADGYVTLPAGVSAIGLPDGTVSISPSMITILQLLNAQGGALVYRGRGMDLIINPGGPGKAGSSQDAVWGPVPEVLEFQPLGGGLSAKVKWQVKTRVPMQPTAKTYKGGLAAIPMLQFNYETTVNYSEDGYSSISIKGTLEIPLTRSPSQVTRTLTQTADDLRSQINTRVMAGIDLARFRRVKGDFSLSRDKRTLEWNFQFDEKPFMDLPTGCTVVRGNYSVRPAKAGMGLCLWLCTLRATYTVRKGFPRRTAWGHFLAMVRLRMAESAKGYVPPSVGGVQNQARIVVAGGLNAINDLTGGRFTNILSSVRDQLLKQVKPVSTARKAWIIDFNMDEGLYLDSKTISFSATWRLTTTFSHIILASGLWRKLPETDAAGSNLWAASMKDVQGAYSWLPNVADASKDIIVDFGGG